MSNNNTVPKPENPTQSLNSIVNTKSEIIADTKLKLIYRHNVGTHCRHKMGTNSPIESRNSITITKTCAKILMSHRL